MGQAKQKKRHMALVGTAPNAVKRISSDDAAYLRKVRQQLDVSARLDQQATSLERQAATLRQQVASLQGAHDSYTAHLSEKYGLNTETDLIDPSNGNITRVSPVTDVLEEEAPAEPAVPRQRVRASRTAPPVPEPPVQE